MIGRRVSLSVNDHRGPVHLPDMDQIRGAEVYRVSDLVPRFVD